MPMTLQQLTNMVANEYDMPPCDLFNQCRYSHVVEARRIVWYMLREYTTYSLPRIGTLFDCTHDNVLRGVRKLKKEMRRTNNKTLRNKVKDFEKRYLNNGQFSYPEWTKNQEEAFKTLWFSPNLTMGAAAQKAGVPRHLFSSRCKEKFGPRHSVNPNPRAFDRMPGQVSKWPDDMPRFEDHPDAGTSRDMGLRVFIPVRRTASA